MTTTLIHTLHDALELCYHGQTLFRYVYASKTPAVESPRPYFHPLKTLAGNEISLFRPYDHLWHAGLSMTIANLSGENFWGGRSYTREAAGYVQFENNGRIQHSAWQEITCDEQMRGIERLQWITQAGATWLEEERRIVVSEIEPGAGYWSLDLAFRLLNVSQQPLLFGSPTTEGRPLAGYGSLFWRGPRSFLCGQILAAGGLEGPEIMGQPAPWLAFIGSHDGNGQQSTILFIDQPGNPRYPNKWFVRNDPYACVSCSFMFDEYYTLLPDATLELTYRVVIANGAWSRASIEHYVAPLHSKR
ncbi:MAG TPA: PmoA family protein [Ktedonobacteraceae bacterium]